MNVRNKDAQQAFQSDLKSQLHVFFYKCNPDHK